jgi:large subunit ribosomal protein L4
MPKVALYNKDGATVGEIELNDFVFGAEVNPALLHEVVVMQLANRRQGTADVKNRSEVSGGGRKPWRQKGTGRARQGSTRAPQWRHGGVVFGPTPRSYAYTMPKKARRRALVSALSSKVQGGNIFVLDQFSLAEPKTKEVTQLLSNLKIGGKALIVTANADQNVYKSARNIEGVAASPALDLNVYDVLNYDSLVITRDAVAKVEEVLA